MIWSSAISREIESADALKDLLPRLRLGLAGHDASALFLFVSPHHSADYDSILDRLRDEFGSLPLIGCSGGGIIGAGKEIEDRPGISLTAASMPGVKIFTKEIRDEELPDPDSPPAAWER